MNNVAGLIFQLVVLIFSVIVHEVSHGATAYRLGDKTAKLAGRLTLNPIPHLDLFGSFLLPVSLYIFSGGAFTLGWAKPVPYNPFNLKNPKLGAGIIAVAGPTSNIAIAIVFSIFIRLIPIASLGFSSTLAGLMSVIIYTNIALALFNLVPIPPLDGAKVLFAFLPAGLEKIQVFLNRYGFFILIFIIFFGFTRYLIPLANTLYALFTGQPGLLYLN